MILIDKTDLVAEDYRPLFGSRRCYIRPDPKIEAIYVYIPITIIIVINITLFMDTARKIWKFQQPVNDDGSGRQKKFMKRYVPPAGVFKLLFLAKCVI